MKKLSKILISPRIRQPVHPPVEKNDKGRTSLIGQQSRTITGTVTDNNGEPVIGANVIIKGTSIGTVTDINGKYTLEVPPKAILQISYIGYLTKEIVIDNNKTADVILIEDTQKIDEVVVVGYGTQRKGKWPVPFPQSNPIIS